MHRIVGTGQFGAVRLVRSRVTNEVFALKVWVVRAMKDVRQRGREAEIGRGPSDPPQAAVSLLLPSYCISLPQAMHKAPIVESKQMEHVLNERRVLEEASTYPFCVQLRGAYQDKRSLYLLQVVGVGWSCLFLPTRRFEVVGVDESRVYSMYLLQGRGACNPARPTAWGPSLLPLLQPPKPPPFLPPQEFVGGGELFHHLDLEGAFDEPTSAFFAANVLLALDFLHNKVWVRGVKSA